MVSILVLFIAIFAIIFFLFVVTYLHYLLHKWVCKDLICYYDGRIYLLRYDTIDILVNITDDTDDYFKINIYIYNLDTYFIYLKYYLYAKYIKNISE